MGARLGIRKTLRLIEFQSILTAIRNLPERMETDPAKVAEHQREKEVIKRRLAALAAANEPQRASSSTQNLALFNGQPGNPAASTCWTTCSSNSATAWPTGGWLPTRSITAGSSTSTSWPRSAWSARTSSRPTHGLVLRLLAEGRSTACASTTPTGSTIPRSTSAGCRTHYLLACAARVFLDESAGQGLDWKDVQGPLRERLDRGGPGTETSPLGPPLYVVAEKILAAGESLVETWAVHGTSGYDFLNQVNGLFVDGDNAQAFSRLYESWIEDDLRDSPRWSITRSCSSWRCRSPASCTCSRTSSTGWPRSLAGRATSPSTPCGRRCGR